jgi:hypothetical protein
VAWTPDDYEDGPPPEDAALDQAIASGDLDEVLGHVAERDLADFNRTEFLLLFFGLRPQFFLLLSSSE